MENGGQKTEDGRQSVFRKIIRRSISMEDRSDENILKLNKGQIMGTISSKNGT